MLIGGLPRALSEQELTQMANNINRPKDATIKGNVLKSEFNKILMNVAPEKKNKIINNAVSEVSGGIPITKEDLKRILILGTKEDEKKSVANTLLTTSALYKGRI